MFDSSTVDPSLRLLSQLFASATQHASLAMAHWTHGQVTLSLDEVRELPLEEVSSELDLGDDLLTMVVLGIEGEASGELILAVDEENGRRLAASLLQRDLNDEPEWSALEQSAFMETGNILASAYLNELTRLVDRKLTPTAPTFVQDFGASVLQQALMMQAMVSDRVLICQTRFQYNREDLNWSVLFVPSQELLEDMHKAIFDED